MLINHVVILLLLFSMGCLGVVFVRCGYSFASIILWPIYICKASGRSPLSALLFFVPLANFIFLYVVCRDIAKMYSLNDKVATFLSFIPPFLFIVLAFSSLKADLEDANGTL